MNNTQYKNIKDYLHIIPWNDKNKTAHAKNELISIVTIMPPTAYIPGTVVEPLVCVLLAYFSLSASVHKSMNAN